MQYFNDKNISLTNLINIALDGAAAITEKLKNFVSILKSVTMFYIHYIIHRQHLAAKNIERHAISTQHYHRCN